MRALLRSGVQFQSTLPARGATEWLDVGFNVSRPFQSTLPARGATRNQMRANRAIQFQSTLPARGATATGTVYQPGYFLISIHAPRTGSDAALRHKHSNRQRFQSTLPARGATGHLVETAPDLYHFNPRSPHGERPVFRHCRRNGHGISIHAPRTGSDAASTAAVHASDDFNPRSPHGERLLPLPALARATHFNPRSPHGERPRGCRRNLPTL